MKTRQTAGVSAKPTARSRQGDAPTGDVRSCSAYAKLSSSTRRAALRSSVLIPFADWMRDPIRDHDCSRERIETRAKADTYFDLRTKATLFKVAEYDRVAERAKHWQTTDELKDRGRK
ncbi:hypothetical protein FXV83_38395 [Bradyrhizobium hipponense]|uniref:Uncharacterized protein n=1 Tax=Bradyrhizobium hipponense TaxID=2605638 RepID=A0A5S4YD18_9BRAD|nr:hypothetical protein [Bradyrhizobium hipponense]TYO61387.1 hypothetical protein FXV83_38395 [Bradyrhizobium hipponense]